MIPLELPPLQMQQKLMKQFEITMIMIPLRH